VRKEDPLFIYHHQFHNVLKVISLFLQDKYNSEGALKYIETWIGKIITSLIDNVGAMSERDLKERKIKKFKEKDLKGVFQLYTDRLNVLQGVISSYEWKIKGEEMDIQLERVFEMRKGIVNHKRNPKADYLLGKSIEEELKQ